MTPDADALIWGQLTASIGMSTTIQGIIGQIIIPSDKPVSTRLSDYEGDPSTNGIATTTRFTQAVEAYFAGLQMIRAPVVPLTSVLCTRR